MQHKFLLRFIKQEMEKEKIISKSNESFFRLFLVDASWESYRSNMSNWLSSSQDGVIRKREFIAAINQKLGLSEEIWGASTQKQKEVVSEGVKRFKVLQESEEVLFPWVEKVGVSREQKAFLEFAEGSSLDEVKAKLNNQEGLFEKTAQCQPFLLEIFEMMYIRGEYLFVYEQIFPYLLDTYNNSIKSKKANIYASLPTPMYREAFEILNSIKGESRAETVDLQTAAISNIRRERLSLTTLSKNELKNLLHTLIKCYTKIYLPKQTYNYYPGINLAYMVALVQYIFPEEPDLMIEGYSIKQIYTDVKKSILEAKKSECKEETYYASMSEIEFHLLLNRQGMVQELEYVLETLKPSQNLINQTKRQMGEFFIALVKRFSDEVPSSLQPFQNFLEVFEDYTYMHKV